MSIHGPLTGFRCCIFPGWWRSSRQNPEGKRLAPRQQSCTRIIGSLSHCELTEALQALLMVPDVSGLLKKAKSSLQRVLKPLDTPADAHGPTALDPTARILRELASSMAGSSGLFILENILIASLYLSHLLAVSSRLDGPLLVLKCSPSGPCRSS